MQVHQHGAESGVWKGRRNFQGN